MVSLLCTIAHETSAPLPTPTPPLPPPRDFQLLLQEKMQGRTLSVMQGARTDKAVLTTLKGDIQKGQAASALLTNYKRDGSSFLNYLRVYPLIGDPLGTVTHFLGVLQVMRLLDADWRLPGSVEGDINRFA